MSVKDEFVAAMIDSLPEGWDRSESSANRLLANLIGAALEKVLAQRKDLHLHFHPTDGQILSAVGNAVLIEPAGDARARAAAGLKPFL